MSRRIRLWLWLGGGLGIALLVWVLRDFEFSRLIEVIRTATVWPLVLLPLAVLLQVLIRAAKWRQILSPIREISTWRLFGAIMAGHLANMIAPAGPLVRAWLVARLESLPTGSLLATVVLDRAVDGLVFVGFAILALVSLDLPDGGDGVDRGLVWATAVTLMLILALVATLISLKRRRARIAMPDAWGRIAKHVPERWRNAVGAFGNAFVSGVVWPREAWRGALIILASIAIKLIAIGYFVWVGLAFGVVLAPQDYLFLMVFLGFLAFLAASLRIVGGFTAGAVFVLEKFGVGVETGLAMALLVEAVTHVTVALAGAIALWLQARTIGAAGDAAHALPNDYSRNR